MKVMDTIVMDVVRYLVARAMEAERDYEGGWVLEEDQIPGQVKELMRYV